MFSWVGAAVAQESATTFGAAGGKPNIVFVLGDDLAWSDLACYGHPWHETPHLNSLAQDGIGFTDGYAPAPICSASRASILTGKSPARLRFEFVTKNRAGRQAIEPRQSLQAPPYTLNLPLEEETLGELLGSAGYSTAFFGKWHVNAHYQRYLGWSPAYGPKRQGFVTAEEDFGSHPYSYGKRKPALVSKKGEFPEDGLTKRAVEFIKLPHRRPFFLMLSHFYVHTPVETPCMWLIAKYQKKIPPETPNRNNRLKYAAFVETLDHQVGVLLKGLKEAGMEKRTLVVFTSDNGGHPEHAANGPMRGSKWNLYEGGIRVPFLVRWPGKVAKGETCRVPVCGYDLFPTFAELARKPIDPKTAGLDGRSLVPLFGNPQQRFNRSLYWHFPYYHPEGNKFGSSLPKIGLNDFKVSQTRPVSALRSGNYKLLHFHEDDRVELYNLEADRSESLDLAKGAPKSAAKLKKELQRYLKEAKARMPAGVIVRK
jgi:uncharacterized sulfatase